MDKQIEEMAKVIMQPQDCKGYEDNRGCYYGNGKGCEKCKIERHENAQIMADYLFNAGYRKIPELPKDTVLTGDDIAELLTIVARDTRKETAEKIKRKAKEKAFFKDGGYYDKDRYLIDMADLDEILKDIMEGKV